MALFALAAKAATAVIFLIAGAAKLADRSDVAEAIRLFSKWAADGPLREPIVVAICVVELTFAAVSLGSPELGVVNILVFILCCTFVVVSLVGYMFHRGKSCMCFGPLSRRRFDLPGLGRSLLLAALAAAAMQEVPETSVGLGWGSRLLILAVAALIAFAGFIAARAMVAVRRGKSMVAS